MRCVTGSEHLVTFREHGLAHRRALQRVRMAFVERDNFEEAVEQDRAAHAPEDGDPHAVARRVQGCVPFQRLAVDPDLKQAEFRGHPAERGHVPVSQGLDGERRRGIARRTGLTNHDGIDVFLRISSVSPENPH